MKRKTYIKKMRAIATELYNKKYFTKFIINGCYRNTRYVRANYTTYDELYGRVLEVYNSYLK